MSSRLPPRASSAIVSILLWMAGAVSFLSAQIPDTLRHPLYAPKTLAQRFEQQGYAVAISGNVAVVGSPFYDRDPVSGIDCGVVKIYDSTSGNLLLQLNSPTGTPFGYFGESVAISGSIVVVGASDPVDGGPYSGCVYVYDLASATPVVPVQSLENPAGSENDQFGHAVAIDGEIIVVGAWMDDTPEVNSGRAYIYDLSSSAPEEPVFVLQNPNPAVNDNFGVAVAVSSSRVAVAAYHDSTGAPGAGRVYIYDLEESAPGQPVLTLGKPGVQRNDCFGNSLAMSGNLVVIGAELSDSEALNSGNAYIFDLDAPTPSQPVHTLKNPFPQTHGCFGRCVSISGEIVAIGAYSHDAAVSNAGACYIYNLGAQNPAVPSVTLAKPAWDQDDYFGNAVAVAEDKVIAASWRDDTGDEDAGISYVYDLAAESPGSPVVALDSPQRGSTDHFGSAVAISGDLVAIGSPDSDAGATRAGRVSVHDLSSSKPSATMVFLDNPNPAYNDGFGGAVAIAGHILAVGAPGDDAGAVNAGSVYVYDFSGDPPSSPLLVVPNPSPAAGDSFGSSVIVSGNLIIVGCSLDDTGAMDSGCVYAFDLSSPNPSLPLRTIINPAPTADDRFGGAIAVSGTRLLVGCAKDDAGAINSGAAYLYELSGSTPAVPALVFTNPAPLAEDGFGGAVAMNGNLAAIGASGDDTGAVDAGSVYVYDLAGAAPTIPLATIPNPAPATDDRFGNALAVAEPRVVVGAYLDNGPTDSGRVYTFNMTSATPTIPTATLAKQTPVNGDQFGASVGISGTIIAVGAPSDNRTATDKGAAYIFGPAAPEIAVQGPTGEELVSGETVGFGAVAIGQVGGSSLTFTILNTGITGLPITGISVTGGESSDFHVMTSDVGNSVPADDDAAFSVILTPTGPGVRATTLRILNGDSNENPFVILLSGVGLSASQDTDGDGLNDVAELRMAALGFDWQTQDPINVAAYKANLSAAGFFRADQVEALGLLGPHISKDATSGNLKLRFSLRRSVDLSTYAPFPMTVPQTSINPDGEFEFRFSVPGDTGFFRLETD